MDHTITPTIQEFREELSQAQTEIDALRDQIEIMNSRIAVDARSYKRDQYLIVRLREQLKSKETK